MAQSSKIQPTGSGFTRKTRLLGGQGIILTWYGGGGPRGREWGRRDSNPSRRASVASSSSVCLHTHLQALPILKNLPLDIQFSVEIGLRGLVCVLVDSQSRIPIRDSEVLFCLRASCKYNHRDGPRPLINTGNYLADPGNDILCWIFSLACCLSYYIWHQKSAYDNWIMLPALKAQRNAGIP